jgi:predicted DNA-binding transcriptional regulator YafY
VSVPGDTLKDLVFAPADPAADAEHRHFALLLEAIQRRRELQLDYRKPRPGAALETRLVHPLHLAYLEHRWVLVAYDAVRRVPRNFLLARIRAAKFTSRIFEPPAKFDLQRYLGNSLGRFSGETDHEVRVVFDAEVAPYLRERPWHASQQIAERPDGGIEATFRLNHLNDIERRILACGAHAQVLAPAELRERLGRTAAAMAASYAPGATRKS